MKFKKGLLISMALMHKKCKFDKKLNITILKFLFAFIIRNELFKRDEGFKYIVIFYLLSNLHFSCFNAIKISKLSI